MKLPHNFPLLNPTHHDSLIQPTPFINHHLQPSISRCRRVTLHTTFLLRSSSHVAAQIRYRSPESSTTKCSPCSPPGRTTILTTKFELGTNLKTPQSRGI
ncbi:hypothetical protein KSS87_004119 [Heliosperma pusillum]|nr:hypothetical protein KSS87_004119 [Heliosperma pusillum]